ncbi:hypothetical protein UP25_23620, partial [Vibrio parahaemolyticus]
MWRLLYFHELAGSLADLIVVLSGLIAGAIQAQFGLKLGIQCVGDGPGQSGGQTGGLAVDIIGWVVCRDVCQHHLGIMAENAVKKRSKVVIA